MKTVGIGSVIFILGLLFMNTSCVHMGNRNVISSERALNSFEKVHSGGSAEVRFHASQDYRAVITVDSNLEEYVELDIRNKTLNIGTKPGRSYSFSTFIVDIYCPALTSVSISGSGKFIGMDTMSAPSFESSVSGSGNIQGTIECDNYSVNISGSGEINTAIICKSLSAIISGSGSITIAGAGNDSDVRISGSGNFNGIDYKTNNASARISGSGNMNIWALETINANVSGSGSIKYRGTPKIEFNGSGSGRIRSE